MLGPLKMTIEIDSDGVYRDECGRRYVRCMADKRNPFFIDVSTFRIEAEWKRQKYWVDLSIFKLPVSLLSAVKEYVVFKLGVGTPRLLLIVRNNMRYLESVWCDDWVDFSDLSLGMLFKLIVGGRVGEVDEFRRIYKYCAANSLAGADEIHALEISSIKIQLSKDSRAILEWDQTRGAMTSAEQELVRRAMVFGKDAESISDYTSRLFTWISFETLKRPGQISEMTADSLWVPDPNAENIEYFLRIPKAKAQIGQEPELWPITERLAKEIKNYSSVPKIGEAQQNSERLLVTLRKGKKFSLGRMMTRWCVRQGIISPRTNDLLVLTPYRIRHSGATQMAAQGASSDELQYILEHDSITAAKAYIDCLASEFCPLLERVNRKLGGVFTELNGIFFSGGIGDKSVGYPVLIPTINAPAAVGSCSKNGMCGQHPFFNCYNGCRYFIAWRDADHEKSLKYLENEFARWGAAEGGKDRSKVLKDLERVYQAVKDVIHRIENGE